MIVAKNSLLSIISIYDMYEMSLYVFCIHMFIIHNYDVINISYNITIKISLMAPFVHRPPLPASPLFIVIPLIDGKLFPPSILQN